MKDIGITTILVALFIITAFYEGTPSIADGIVYQLTEVKRWEQP